MWNGRVPLHFVPNYCVMVLNIVATALAKCKAIFSAALAKKRIVPFWEQAKVFVCFFQLIAL